MGERNNPVFRADHVGSLLRPPEVAQARAETLRDGALTSPDLKPVEDTAIGADAAAAAGLRTVIVNRMGLPTGGHTVVSAVDGDLLLLWLGR